MLSFYVTDITDVNSPDCYSAVRLEMHRTFFILTTDVNKNATKCSMSYVESQLKQKVEQIHFSVIICQNEDKSGFTYNRIYEFEGYALGDDLRKRLECAGNADCGRFAELLWLLAVRSNIGPAAHPVRQRR